MILLAMADGWLAVHNTADSQWLAVLFPNQRIITSALRHRQYPLVAWRIRQSILTGIVGTRIFFHNEREMSGYIRPDIEGHILEVLQSPITDEQLRDVLEGAWYLGWRGGFPLENEIIRQRPQMKAVFTQLRSTEPAPREGIPPLPAYTSSKQVSPCIGC
jgi:hypothetical protein